LSFSFSSALEEGFLWPLMKEFLNQTFKETKAVNFALETNKEQLHFELGQIREFPLFQALATFCNPRPLG